MAAAYLRRLNLSILAENAEIGQGCYRRAKFCDADMKHSPSKILVAKTASSKQI
jgi:hypothetical protein